MFYDQKQFNKDLSLIVQFFGERRQHGMFTEGRYEYEDFFIVDPYTMNARIYEKDKLVENDKIKIDSRVGDFVLKKAIEAEELLWEKCRLNPVWMY